MQKLLFKLSMEHLGKLLWKKLPPQGSKMGSNVIIYIMFLSNYIYHHVIQNFDGGESWNGF